MTAPRPTPETARTAGTFEAAMWAMARPGEIREMRAMGPEALAEALLDAETTFGAEDPASAEALRRFGARPAALGEAASVFAALDGPGAADLPDRLARGSHAHPDRGATLIAPARLGAGAPHRLAGPGIDDMREVALGDVAPAFWPRRAARLRPPLGFEICLVEGPLVLGLPRTTTVTPP